MVDFRLVGGGDAPGRTPDGLRTFGRARVSWPFAVLELSGSTLTFRFRPSWMRTNFSLEPLSITPSRDVAVIRAGSAIGLVLPDDDRYLLALRPVDSYLDHIESAGFRVDRRPGHRRPTQYGNWQGVDEYARTRRSRPGTSPPTGEGLTGRLRCA